jgi:hypothetical protein
MREERGCIATVQRHDQPLTDMGSDQACFCHGCRRRIANDAMTDAGELREAWARAEANYRAESERHFGVGEPPAAGELANSEAILLDDAALARLSELRSRLVSAQEAYTAARVASDSQLAGSSNMTECSDAPPVRLGLLH